MNAQSILPQLKLWFDEYTHGFLSDDPVVHESMDLKKEHTLRVCRAAADIGGDLKLSSDDLCIAEIAALLHDIGRFDQYRQYRTFSDFKSVNHADLGVEVIKAEHVLGGLETASAEIIISAVGYHNRMTLPDNEEARSLLFLKLLRDADKVDIWRVVTDYYRNGGVKKNKTIELDLPDTPQISAQVYRSLMNGHLVNMADVKTLNDFKLLQIGWVYDLNYPRAFQIVREKGYLKMIRDSLPPSSDWVEEIYDRASEYMVQNT